MQIKTIMRYHRTPGRMAKIRDTTIQRKWTIHTLLAGMQNDTATLENTVVVS